MHPWETEDHRIFRQAFRTHLAREVTPRLADWDAAGQVPREAWLALGRQGFLCPWAGEAHGGAEADFGFSAVINQELGRCGALGFLVGLHSDIIAPYIASFGSQAQQDRYLPGAVSGELLLAVAMTEPDAGSDLQAMRATAVRDGGDWVINGQKTFISNGLCCDAVIVAAKTDPNARPAHKGISLFIVDHGAPGFAKGRKLAKMGLHAQDTAELFFSDCRVPASALLGQEGAGFGYLMQKLQAERLICAITAQGAAEWMLGLSLDYAKERRAFGAPIGALQHNSFKLAEMATEVELGRVFIDALIAGHLAGADIGQRVSMAKWWIGEMANRIAYHGVQLHGGYGYMEEYPICRAYRDIRVHTIYAGTTEVMKAIIARNLGL